MKQDTPIVMVPTAGDVAAVEVGSMVLDSMGSMRRVVRVAYRGVDIKGAPFVGFDTEFGPGSTLSGSYKAGELCRTVHLTAHHNAEQCRAIERRINAERAEVRS